MYTLYTFGDTPLINPISLWPMTVQCNKHTKALHTECIYKITTIANTFQRNTMKENRNETKRILISFRKF